MKNSTGIDSIVFTRADRRSRARAQALVDRRRHETQHPLLVRPQHEHRLATIASRSTSRARAAQASRSGSARRRAAAMPQDQHALPRSRAMHSECAVFALHQYALAGLSGSERSAAVSGT